MFGSFNPLKPLINIFKSLLRSVLTIATTLQLLGAAFIFLITDLFQKNPGEGILGCILYMIANYIKLFVSIKVGKRNYLGSVFLSIYPFWVINSIYVTLIMLLQVLYNVIILIPPAIICLLDVMIIKKDSKKHYSLYQFYYKFIHANETSPDNWNTLNSRNRPNIAFGNLFMYRPCPQRYTHRGGLFCQPIKDYLPSLSQQANVYNMANDQKVKGPVIPVLITKTVRYKIANDRKKTEMLEEYTRELKRYYEETNATMKPYDTIAKNICRSCTQENKTMQQTCYQTYCTNGRWENFCHKYTVRPKPLLNFAEQEPIPKYSSYAVIAILITLVVLVFIQSLINENAD